MYTPLAHPVIVFSHGLGGCRLVYSNVCCDMASHGYVVAAVEHKDRSACASLSRVPPAGVGHGCYHDYVDEWLPYEVAELEVEFYFRNRQVISEWLFMKYTYKFTCL